MLIDHPTDGATCVFLFSNREGVLRIDALWPAAICIFIELYDGATLHNLTCIVHTVYDLISVVRLKIFWARLEPKKNLLGYFFQQNLT